MIASVARFRIKSAWASGVSGLLTIAVAVALMAYAAPAHARGQVQPAVTPTTAHVSDDLIHRTPSAGIPKIIGANVGRLGLL